MFAGICAVFRAINGVRQHSSIYIGAKLALIVGLLSFGAVAAIGSAAVIDRLAVDRAERGNDAVYS